MSGESCLSRIAADSPAGPAPTTTTSNSMDSRGSSLIGVFLSVIASEAKQSQAAGKVCRDCFASLAMTTDIVGWVELLRDPTIASTRVHVGSRKSSTQPTIYDLRSKSADRPLEGTVGRCELALDRHPVRLRH